MSYQNMSLVSPPIDTCTIVVFWVDGEGKLLEIIDVLKKY